MFHHAYSLPPRWLTVGVCLLMAALASGCVVPADDLKEKGIMGHMWQLSGKDIAAAPVPYSDLEEHLFTATESGDLGTALDLLDQGASVRAVHPDGDRLITVAIRNGQTELVALLLQHDAPISAEDYCLATTNDRLGCLHELLNYHTNLNVICSRGDTPLTRAVRFGEPEVVLKMLTIGAKPHLANREGRTPSHYAQEKENLGGFPDWAVNYDRINAELRKRGL